MKKYIKYSAAAISAIVIVTIGVTAFAEDSPILIRENNAVISDTFKDESKYSILNGTIKAITISDDGSARIEFNSTEKGDIIFNETVDGCVIIDRTTLTGFASLKCGDKVTVVMNNYAPMTMSYPGQTSGAVAFVVNNDKSIVVDKLDDELTGSTVAITIGENTQIVDSRGTKQLITKDGVKGHECLVIYGAATKSIPAQTTPDLVVVLDNAETEPQEDKSIPLRKAFEDIGYKIVWTSNDKPITITNGTITATVSIGSKVVIFNDEVIVLPSEVELIDGVTHVSADIIKLFK
ncbi:hypothetical protein SDC9_60610 [bioreactor metagenome]|uniref:Copper amine oxidase-like N-terminal domain-containing protein n=1 Tax=bioreactor metagenome TaxID=1076179 RepID=A0A644XDS9_9ZZZZ